MLKQINFEIKEEFNGLVKVEQSQVKQYIHLLMREHTHTDTLMEIDKESER